MKEKSYNIENEEEINLGEFFKFLSRNSSYLLIFSVIGSIFGIGISLNTKKIWRGEFQIVLEKEDSKSSSIIQSLTNDSRVAGFASNVGLNSKNKQLETEVEILKSPSVLFPIYEFVKQTKKDNNQRFTKSFNQWYQSTISVRLKRGTSVLNFTYRDIDKDLIIPTLTEISKKYQAYSGEERERTLNNGLNYLQKQIAKYEKISSDSSNKLQSFSYKHNLISNSTEEFLSPSIASEVQRISAVNKLNLIDKQLDEINKIPKESEFIYFLAKRIYSTNQIKIDPSSPINNLKELNQEITYKKSIYKDADPDVINLINTRKKLIRIIRSELVNSLNAEKNSLKAFIDANTKPKEIILKYFKLLRESAENAQILIGLKTNQSTLFLKKAEINDPWQLITKPTLADSTIGPSKKTISFIGLILGSLTGLLVSFIKEKISDKVYSKNEIEKLLEIPFIEEINLKDIEKTKEIIKLLSLGKLNITKDETLAIVPIGNIKEEFLEKFIVILKSFISNKKIEIIHNLSEAKEFTLQLFLASTEVTKTSEISNIKKLLKLQNHNSVGWILLSFKDFKKDT
tara:strand:- start:390 stop:2102 length:1713 start_codon:yes stop_codon:yes gene_type:complete